MIGIAYIALKTTDGATCGHACIRNGCVEFYMRRPMRGEAVVCTNKGLVCGDAQGRLRVTADVRAVALHEEGRVSCCGFARDARMDAAEVARLLARYRGATTSAVLTADDGLPYDRDTAVLQALKRLRALEQAQPQPDPPTENKPHKVNHDDAMPEQATIHAADQPAQPAVETVDTTIAHKDAANDAAPDRSAERITDHQPLGKTEENHATYRVNEAYTGAQVQVAVYPQTLHGEIEDDDEDTPDAASFKALFRRVQDMDARIRAIVPPCMPHTEAEQTRCAPCTLAQRMRQGEAHASEAEAVHETPAAIRAQEPNEAAAREAQDALQGAPAQQADDKEAARETDAAPCEADRLADEVSQRAFARTWHAGTAPTQDEEETDASEAPFSAAAYDGPVSGRETPRASRAVRTPVLNPFPHIFPNARFYREEGAAVETLLGSWSRGGERMCITAITGDYCPHPPAHLEGFTRYIRSRTGGYWVKVEPN